MQLLVGELALLAIAHHRAELVKVELSIVVDVIGLIVLRVALHSSLKIFLLLLIGNVLGTVSDVIRIRLFLSHLGSAAEGRLSHQSASPVNDAVCTVCG